METLRSDIVQVAVKGLPAKLLIKKLMYNVMAAVKPLSGTDAASSRITLARWDYSCGGSAAAQEVTFRGALRCYRKRNGDCVFFYILFFFYVHIT